MRKALFFAIFGALPLLGSSQTTASKPAVRRPVAAAPQPTAIIATTAGNLTCTLFPKKAPIGVANFIGLANGTKEWTNPLSGRHVKGEPLYDRTIFHRVIPDFMIQGGDPAGSGSGEIGFRFQNETSPDLTFDRPGRLAYANAGPGTNGSQFFITEVPYPSLDGNYTIFGQCDPASVELVKKIARMPRDGNDRPVNPVTIKHITILHGGAPQHPATRPVAPHKPATNAAPKAAPKTSQPQ
jgi:peptidyl-prolyl cis-trans isomerase A (cyclophilin A)